MSRLESFIRRLEAQRACLDWAAGQLRDRPGLVLEMGLGNGRTFDHLRLRLPGRRILVFEREPNPHAASSPPPGDMILGPIETTLPQQSDWLTDAVALAHSDIGCGDPAVDARLAAFLARHLPPLLAEGGLILSDQRLETAALAPVSLPPGVAAGRYFLYAKSRQR